MITHKRRNLLIEKILPGILLAIVVMWAFFPIVNAIIGSLKMPLHIWDFPPRFFGPFYSLTNYPVSYTHLDVYKRQPSSSRSPDGC